jgi:hypothetical protein
MSRLAAAEVFTPTSFPTHTYVLREDHHNERLLTQWRKSPTQIATIAGPSKAGKTVLVQRVVGEGKLITVSGASVRQADQLWERVLDWLGEPHATTAGSVAAHTRGRSIDGGTSAAPLGVGVTAKLSDQRGQSETESLAATSNRRGLPQVVAELAHTETTLLLDDFHYIPAAIQTELAQQIKDAASRGVRICVASVPHRADNVVRALPELRGRVLAIDLEYWSTAELLQIPRMGFPLLGFSIDDASLHSFATEAAGSPQLMQAICLWLCNHLGVEETLPLHRAFVLTQADRTTVLRLTSNMADFRSLVRALVAGPKVRSERKMYDHRGGGKGHVYLSVMRALALDPPRLTFDLEEITRRLGELCDRDVPPEASVLGSCQAIGGIAESFAAPSPSLEWDEGDQVLLLPDPYLLFYLRWSKHLEREAASGT